ncbi:tripartite tricarboxylate transporter substrate binding protein [Desulfovibrio sp. OttesenSCG-928-O18]|nr:tripartite tricarboxylate transporter substrate binding protein [Desulfovibrio sp. OttesenSCG-928-O18]
MKKRIFALLMAAAFLCVPFTGQAADWPTKPITIIVVYSAGGSHDTMARILVPQLEKILGVKVIVKNSAGAGGTVGAAEVASSKPDGYTYYLMTAGPAISMPTVRKLPYTPESFQMISQMYNSPHTLMVSKDSPYKTLDDFVKAAKEKPGELIVSTVGTAGMLHLTLLDFLNAFDIKVRVMAERSGSEAMKNLAGGVLNGSVDSEGYITRFDNRGLVRFWPERSKLPGLTEVPAVKEFGKEVYWTTWAGIGAPKGVPADIVKKMDAALAEASKSAKLQELAMQNGFTVEYLPTAAFEKVFKDEVARVTMVLKREKLIKDE